MAIVFVIILTVVIAKFVVPQFEATYAERTAAIQGGMEKAEKAQAEAEAALKTYQAQLAEARSEAAKIREDAKTQGTQIIAELREQAQAEASRIRQAAEAQLEAERTQVLTQLRSEIGGLATTLAGRIVGESLTDDERARRTVDRFLADLESDSDQHPGGDLMVAELEDRLGVLDGLLDEIEPTDELATICSRSWTPSTVRPRCVGCSPTRGHRRTPARRSPGGCSAARSPTPPSTLVETGRSATLVRRSHASPPPWSGRPCGLELVLADRAGHLDETEDELFRFARLVESDSVAAQRPVRALDRPLVPGEPGRRAAGGSGQPGDDRAGQAGGRRARAVVRSHARGLHQPRRGAEEPGDRHRPGRSPADRGAAAAPPGRSVATGRTRDRACRSSSSRTCWAESGSSSAPRSSRGRCPAAWPRPTSSSPDRHARRPRRTSTTPDDTTHH